MINSRRLLFGSLFYKTGLFFLLYFFYFSSFAQPVIAIEQGMERIDLAGKAEYFVDAEGKKDINKILNTRSDWKLLPGNTLNLGYSNAIVWIRFTVDQRYISGNNTLALEVAYPTLDSVDLYYSLNTDKVEQNWINSATGENYIYANREIDHRNFIFHLAAINNIKITYYLRVRSESSIQIPMSLLTLSSLTGKISMENYLFGVYFGIIFIMMFYNLFIFFSIKDRSYLYYVLFIGCTGLFHMCTYGLAHEFLWPGNSWWVNHSILFFASSISLFISLFTRSFLDTRNNARFFDKLFLLFTLLALVGIGLSLFGPYQLTAKFSAFLILLTLLSAFITGILCLKKGFRPARYFMLAWLGIIMGGVVYALKQFGVLPNIFVTEYGVLFGSTILVVLLSFALADRINNLKKEKEEIREKTLELLEFKVEERTAEVVLQKQIIETKNKDITDSIKYARRIQQAILPSEPFYRSVLPESFVYYKPKDIVSGDFYWVDRFGDKSFLAAVDCTGHGVPGALMSMVGFNILNQALNEHGLSKPNLIMNALHKGVYRTLQQKAGEATIKDGMDISLVAIDHKKKIIEFAGAFNPVWIISDGELKETKGDKKSIGSYTEDEIISYKNNEIPVRSGDCAYIFTDGFADQFGGPEGKKFMYKQMKDALLSVCKRPMQEQQLLISARFDQWKGNLEQVDDVLVMGVRI